MIAIIDADYLLYKVYPETEDDVSNPLSFKEGKAQFKGLVEELLDDMHLLFEYKITKHKVVMSDATNFRYELFPAYKEKRTVKRTENFYKLQEWARKKYVCWPNLEADDVCGWYARYKKKVIIVSNDKDVLYGLPGVKFDPYIGRKWFIEVSQYEADRFILMQTLAGDATDGIPGIPRVGMKTAEKLLNEFGWDWAGVVKAYQSRGLTERDAILTRRLVGLDQVTKKKKLKLFKGEKI